MSLLNSLSYIHHCIIDIQQWCVMNKQSCIQFQQCFFIKQTYSGLNKLYMLSTNYFEIQQFRRFKINNLQKHSIFSKIKSIQLLNISLKIILMVHMNIQNFKYICPYAK